MPEGAFDYVVVGSGAGGGTLAARLAESRKRVLVLEAGADPGTIGGDDLPQNYDVPAFHPFASEDPQLSWNFFVDHYADRERQRQDPKWREKWHGRAVGGDGILYPRACALGGCTAHNAMIFVRPDDADWDHIASLTQDSSWAAARMRRHFRQLEDCRHRPPWRWLRWLGINLTGHGFGGWLQTERAWPAAVTTDPELMRVLLKSIHAALEGEADLEAKIASLFARHKDPNDFRGKREGLCYTPTSTRDFKRVGARERLLSVREKLPDYLHIEMNALATRVVLDEDKRAVAVEYLKGERLYAAHTSVSTSAGEPRTATVRGEVILAGGAFNTPQLLMLSGIGDPAALARWTIPVQVSLPGVGKNLQDRYEVGVVNRMRQPWEAMRGARFMKGDRLYEEWLRCRAGSMYGSNGAAISVIHRSSPRAPPDLFCMALLARFEGYFPGYSQHIRDNPDYLTWCILKAHTQNRAGEVTLRSKNPRDTPQVNFNYFTGDGADEDLQSVVEGIKFVRKMTAVLRNRGVIAEETSPGDALTDDAGLREFVRTRAWGHHASCSCAIGPRESGGVLNSRFEVHGTRGLRVVDASVFPRIPGFFVASAVYMIAEKAAETLLK